MIQLYSKWSGDIYWKMYLDNNMSGFPLRFDFPVALNVGPGESPAAFSICERQSPEKSRLSSCPDIFWSSCLKTAKLCVATRNL